jgi:hypothetical protein
MEEEDEEEKEEKEDEDDDDDVLDECSLADRGLLGPFRWSKVSILYSFMFYLTTVKVIIILLMC